jgi:hypothetical protein
MNFPGTDGGSRRLNAAAAWAASRPLLPAPERMTPPPLLSASPALIEAAASDLIMAREARPGWPSHPCSMSMSAWRRVHACFSGGATSMLELMGLAASVKELIKVQAREGVRRIRRIGIKSGDGGVQACTALRRRTDRARVHCCADVTILHSSSPSLSLREHAVPAPPWRRWLETSVSKWFNI